MWLGWRRRPVLQIRRCWLRSSSLKPSRTHTRLTSQGSLWFSNAPAEQSAPRCETYFGGRVDRWSGVDCRVPGPGQISCDQRHKRFWLLISAKRCRMVFLRAGVGPSTDKGSTVPTEELISSRLSLVNRSKLIFLAAGLVSLVLAVGLWFTGNKEQGLFVGLWVPAVHSLGALVLANPGEPS